MSTPSQDLARFAAELRAEDLPDEVRGAAGLHVLDTIGCGLAALATGQGGAVLGAATEEGSTGTATGIGADHGLPSADAALVNGTLCHALDYDDTHAASVVHVSTTVVPAALAAGQQAGAGGADVLRAVVAGAETATRIGMAARGRFHARGLHPTGVCGVFGAAVAAAVVRGLDADRVAAAVGIAGSMAGGLLEFLADGSGTKPLHAGWAAHAGVVAARLAAHGATGPASVLEGEKGFFATYLHGEAVDIAAQTDDLGVRWETPAIAFKPYPVCHYAHAPLDALDRLNGEHRLRPDDVAEIVAVTDATGIGLVLEPVEVKRAPRTPHGAKFSLPYCLAHLLVHGSLDVASFTPQAIRDPAVLAVAARVTYERADHDAAPDAFPGGVRVTLRDGRVLAAEVQHQRGGVHAPMTDREILEKWRRGALLALPPEAVETLEHALLHLGEQEDLAAVRLLSRAASPSDVRPATLST
ncbi:MmgE/PrpD family protein [Paraconexibacter sp.]|uniref:MmgE/PrpD family protein n=1 Tax=Paraconexibacter sp. TaxID=2949640 RepID=UPI0035658495